MQRRLDKRGALVAKMVDLHFLLLTRSMTQTLPPVNYPLQSRPASMLKTRCQIWSTIELHRDPILLKTPGVTVWTYRKQETYRVSQKKHSFKIFGPEIMLFTCSQTLWSGLRSSFTKWGTALAFTTACKTTMSASR